MKYSEWKQLTGVSSDTRLCEAKIRTRQPDIEVYDTLKKINTESAERIDQYQQTIKNGGYMSEDDLRSYHLALEAYDKTGSRMYKEFGGADAEKNAVAQAQWTGQVDALKSNYDRIYNYYSGFESEDAYNQSKKEAERWRELMAVDVTALQGELDEVNAFAEQYYLNAQQLKEYYLNPDYSGITDQQAYAMERWLEEKEAKYGFKGSQGLKGLISEKTSYLNQVERMQAWDAMEAVSDPTRQEYDPDFQNHIGYVSTWVGDRQEGSFDVQYDDFYGSQPGEANSGYADVTYEFINGNAMISEYLTGIENNYYYLEEREKQIYNYYYATQGRAVAEEYLKMLADNLNERAARAEFARIQGRTGLELVFAAEAGLDQFATGISSLFNTEGEYRATSKTQYMSNMVRDDLADNGPALPDWLGGASLGQGAYDLINSTANMAPSLLASAAVGMVSKTAGMVVGNALMGASVAGNAYQTKLNMGYTREQAAAYGLLVGASEVVLGTVLDAVGHWGGELTKTAVTNIGIFDDVLGRVAQNAGVKTLLNAASEGYEEYLQTKLEPFIWEAVTGEVMTVSQEEAMYSALLGFVSGGMVEGAGAAFNAITKTQGKANTAADIRSNTLEAQQFADRDGASLPTDGGLDTDGSRTDTSASPKAATDTFGTSKADSDMSEDTDAYDGEIGEVGSADLTSQALLQQAVGEMGSRPMDPKTYNALFGYKTQAEQVGRVESLLSQQQEILSRQQAEGATAYDIGKTQANIQKLQTLLKTRQKQLHATSQTPILQQVTEKTRTRLPQEPTTAENSRKNVLDISRKIDTIKAEGKIITDGSHIKNGKLQPNVTYQTGENAYYCTTNENGLICRAFTESLQLKKHSGRKKHNPNTYGKQRGDHAGHLFGDRFGGSPELDNLVSQAARVNLSEYKKIENIWEGALRNGQSVSVDIALEYGDGNRPTSFTVTYVIDGESHTQYIKNQ